MIFIKDFNYKIYCAYIQLFNFNFFNHAKSVPTANLLRLDRLGDGGESASSAIATAQAVVAEAGDGHVHNVTKQVASLKPGGNSNRDLFRFVSLPLDITWVTCPVYEKPGSDKIVDGRLPIYDPHELLQYLWTTGRLKADASTIETISYY